MKQYRICTRDKSFPATWIPWNTCYSSMEAAEEEMKERGSAPYLDFKIQEREISEWSDVA